MKIEISGSSDDLIEVDGDISEEFYASSDDGGDFLVFSDGTILRICYTTEGIWRITPCVAGSASYTLVHQGIDDDDYSDRATLEGEITWVAKASQFAKASP